eukprot:4833727-Lingulodinium_polyedra.AAC.1
MPPHALLQAITVDVARREQAARQAAVVASTLVEAQAAFVGDSHASPPGAIGLAQGSSPAAADP